VSRHVASDQPRVGVIAAAGRESDNDPHRFAVKKGILRQGLPGPKNHRSNYQLRRKSFHDTSGERFFA
jgi:hypothetical protein